MALTTESDKNEESQTRQLRVNKKLSKVISSVPRSRFQKPRPNLPGSKRTEPNVPVTHAKTSEKTDKNLPEKKEISTAKAKSIKILSGKDETSTLNENPENKSTEKKEISSANEKTQIEVLKSCIDSSLGKSLDPVEVPENLNTQEITLIGDDDNSITTNTESLQSLKKPPEANLADKNKNQPVINSPDKSKTQPASNVVSSAITTNTDRSSKYPHLTSILSKKRAEPRKEVQHKRHRKFKKGDVIPERSKMTMADLIYWNPVNPDPPPKNTSDEETEANSNYEEPEECVDNPVDENNDGDSSAGLSVPKLVIAEDGSINIDQSSLVVSRNIPEPTVTEVVRKDDTTYSSFRKRPMTKQWTAKDTTIFYKALSLVGTDFGLMEKIFPHRSRRELKLKFKREEKFNIDLINRAMYESHLTFDGTTLEDLIEQLNDLIFDHGAKSKDNKPKEKKTAENKSNNTAQKKSTGRKRKIATESVEDDVIDETTESVINEASDANAGTDLKKPKARRKRKTKKVDEDFADSDESSATPNAVSVIEKEQTKIRRNRKTKKLPDDFIDSDEINMLIEEEIHIEAVCEDEQSLCVETEEISESVLNSSMKDKLETTNIEILCMENVIQGDLNGCVVGDEALILSKNSPQKISLVDENKQEQCITLEYVDDVNQNTDTTLVNNVMAYEVVSSSSGPIPRRRKMNFTPKVPKIKEKISDQQPKISSTSYTPV